MPLNNSNPTGFGALEHELLAAIKKIKKRLRKAAKKNRRPGEKFKIIARPYQRRATLDTTVNFGVDLPMIVTVRAENEDGKTLEITRIWGTINGRNRDYYRPSKGKGQSGFLGPYDVTYKPASTGLSKFKVQTKGKEPSIIYYQVKRAG